MGTRVRRDRPSDDVLFMPLLTGGRRRRRRTLAHWLWVCALVLGVFVFSALLAIRL